MGEGLQTTAEWRLSVTREIDVPQSAIQDTVTLLLLLPPHLNIFVSDSGNATGGDWRSKYETGQITAVDHVLNSSDWRERLSKLGVHTSNAYSCGFSSRCIVDTWS